MMRPEDVPTTFAAIPSNWGKWSRVTQYTDTGEITWAVGWCGECIGSGKAGSMDHAASSINRKAAAALMEFKSRVATTLRRAK